MPAFHVAPFNQYSQQVLNAGSDLYRFEPDVVFLALGLEDLCPQAASPANRGEPAGARRALIEQVLGLVQAIESNSKALAVVHSFSALGRDPQGILQNRLADSFAGWLAGLNDELAGALRTHARSFLMPLDAVLGWVGRERSHHPKTWHMGSMRIAEAALPELARYSMRYVKALMGLTKKCVVLDLDGTLWGGIVGEAGPEGIALGPTAPGIEYVEFQRALLELTRRGVLLAICSKNNPDDALPVIRTHPHMVLREENFAAMRINWNNKADNIAEIAEELNIGVDSLAYIDDNPNERELIRQLLPEVLTVELPRDPSLYRRMLEDMTDFDLLALTQEDEKRAARYQANAKRRVEKSVAASLDEYLRSLEIRARIGLASPDSLGRLVQMFNKTNQFNLTTKRYQAEDVTRFMKSDEFRVYDLRVADRFGDHGLVGTAVVRAAARRMAHRQPADELPRHGARRRDCVPGADLLGRRSRAGRLAGRRVRADQEEPAGEGVLRTARLFVVERGQRPAGVAAERGRQSRQETGVDRDRTGQRGAMTVEEVVARVFNLDPSEVTDESSKDTIEEWDSMGNMSLVTGLEEAFSVSLSIADAMEMTSVQRIKSMLREYGVAL